MMNGTVELSEKALAICATYFRKHSTPQWKDCCKGCPIAGPCGAGHQTTLVAISRHNAAINAAAERI